MQAPNTFACSKNRAAMADKKRQSTPVVIRTVLSDPHWWFKDVVMALILGILISGGSIVSQMKINDHRVAREDARVESENLHAEQLANLRYVRDGSSPDPARSRPYSYFNLEGKDLVGLQLAGADFAFADLADTRLMQIHMERGDLTRADLRGADMRQADLHGAYFGVDRLQVDPSQPGADLTGADLTGADLTGADLSHANLTDATLTDAKLRDVFWDPATVWPSGFVPPPSRPER
jgi:uncharacterized protein YjbI with pentapeptide repeats